MNSQSLVELITPIYQQILEPRQGPLSMTALVKPNAVLLIGRAENMVAVKDLIEKLDQPLSPETQLKLFPLRYMSAADAEQRITSFFSDTTGLSPRVRVVSDYRTNSLIVQADERDLKEVTRLIEQLDVESVEATTQLRVFRLKNTLAEELQTVLQEAITRQTTGQGGAAQGQSTLPSGKVQILGVDDVGNKIVESGILADVTVTADANLNALVVRARPRAWSSLGN